MKAPVTRYIVAAISRVTSQQSYYSGLVTRRSAGQYAIENNWTTERRFATQFGTYVLAKAIADKFLAENNLMDFLVLEERT